MVKRKIPIVDDENVVAKDLEGRLTILGYDVAGIASSEDEGSAMIAKTAPDLVLMDMRLRDVNGVGADKKPHRYGNLPVVFMVGKEDAARVRPPRVKRASWLRRKAVYGERSAPQYRADSLQARHGERGP